MPSNQVKLEKRAEFDEKVGREFRGRISLRGLTCQSVVSLCQDLFIDELELPTTIAKNDALKENVWMVTECLDYETAFEGLHFGVKFNWTTFNRCPSAWSCESPSSSSGSPAAARRWPKRWSWMSCKGPLTFDDCILVDNCLP